MDNAIFSFPKPINEPVKAYAPGSSEKSSLKKALAQLSSEEWDIPLVIGGKEIRTGNTGKVVMPHDHHHVLATYHKAGEKEVQMAIDAAMKAHKEWSELPWVERASVMLRVAELLSTKYRYILNASVMLGQSKNPFQAEIDAPCELIDFLRFSTFYASQVYADQPYSETGILNRMEYRALEGFVFSLTPFNFTSIASNLNMAPAMMGNVAVWKPSTTAIHSNYFLMKVFREAGLPDGVVNFIPGQGSVIGKVITIACKNRTGQTIRRCTVAEFECFFIFIIIIHIDRDNRTEDLLHHTLEHRVRSPDDSRFNKVTYGLISISTENDFRIRRLFCIIDIAHDIVERSFIDNRIDKIREILDISHFDFFQHIADIVLYFFPE